MKLPRLEGKPNTLANGISIAGICLVGLGIRAGVDTRKGFALVAAGRLCDLVDGPVARAMGQATPLGAALDIACDKAGCAAILFETWRKGIVPGNVAAGMVIQNVGNGIAAKRNQKAHPDEEFLPSWTGKLTMATQNLAFLSSMVEGIAKNEATEMLLTQPSEEAAILETTPQIEAKLAKYQHVIRTSHKLGEVAAVEGVLVLGIAATRGYLARA